MNICFIDRTSFEYNSKNLHSKITSKLTKQLPFKLPFNTFNFALTYYLFHLPKIF